MTTAPSANGSNLGNAPLGFGTCGASEGSLKLAATSVRPNRESESLPMMAKPRRRRTFRRRPDDGGDEERVGGMDLDAVLDEDLAVDVVRFIEDGLNLGEENRS